MTVRQMCLIGLEQQIKGMLATATEMQQKMDLLHVAGAWDLCHEAQVTLLNLQTMIRDDLKECP